MSWIPVATLGILGLLFVVYLGQQVWGFEPGLTQSYRSLVAMGGADRALVVESGGWWRVLTSVVLHSGMAHLSGNAYALFLAGFLAERRIGAGWLAAVFAIGGLAGSLATLMWSSPTAVSVGASGAVVAVLVVALASVANNGGWTGHRLVVGQLVSMVGGAVIPTPIGLAHHINYSAHIGGALAGVAFGLLLLGPIPDMLEDGAARKVAGAVGAAIMVLTMAAFSFAAAGYPAFAARNAALIPDGELAKLASVKHKLSDDELAARDIKTQELLARFPTDPRVHMFRAEALLRSREVFLAEQELRVALAQKDVMARDLPPMTEPMITAMLALVLRAQGRIDEAQSVSQALCARPEADPTIVKLKAALRGGGVCPKPGSAAS
ncbi:MAG: rhomboid family intramembrane serine protease [Caulobacteraceae bacterium]|nr:rhomboid family intramembrane serine protease [Caulobacteraceae bacterium]